MVYTLRFLYQGFKVLLGISFLMLLSSCKEHHTGAVIKDSEQVDTRVKVTLSPVKNTSRPIPIYTYGIIRSAESSVLSFRNEGLLAKLHFEEGSLVKKGELLAELRSTEIDAVITKVEKRVEQAKRDLDRIKSVFADSAATAEQVEQIKLVYELAKADLEIQYLHRENNVLVSPIEGKVLKKMVSDNERVRPGQPICELATAYRSKIIVCQLSDKDIAKIKIGTPAEIYLDALPNRKIKGSVYKIPESANPMTGTFDIEILLNLKNKSIRDGAFGRVKLSPRNDLQYFKLPINSIVEYADAHISVFVPNLKDSTVKSQTLRLLQINQQSVFTESRDSIDQVVNYGAKYLKSGDRIIW